MQVNQVMTRNVRHCRTWDALSEAAQQMSDGDCGCIPVLADDGSQRVVGVITDRDICMATHLRDELPSKILVGDVMSRNVRSVKPSATLAEAESMMSEAQVRRLPVEDDEQKLVGILALADLAREAQRMRTADHPEITEDEVGDTLSAISMSRFPTEIVASP